MVLCIVMRLHEARPHDCKFSKICELAPVLHLLHLQVKLSNAAMLAPPTWTSHLQVWQSCKSVGCKTTQVREQQVRYATDQRLYAAKPKSARSSVPDLGHKIVEPGSGVPPREP